MFLVMLPQHAIDPENAIIISHHQLHFCKNLFLKLLSIFWICFARHYTVPTHQLRPSSNCQLFYLRSSSPIPQFLLYDMKWLTCVSIHSSHVSFFPLISSCLSSLNDDFLFPSFRFFFVAPRSIISYAVISLFSYSPLCLLWLQNFNMN